MLSHFHLLDKHHFILLVLTSQQKAYHSDFEFTGLKCTYRIPTHELSAGSPPFPSRQPWIPTTFSHMGQLPASPSCTVLKSLYPSITVFQSPELSYYAAVTPWQPWSCTHTSNSSFFFPILHVLVQGIAERHPNILISQKAYESFLFHNAVPQVPPYFHTYSWNNSTSVNVVCL